MAADLSSDDFAAIEAALSGGEGDAPDFDLPNAGIDLGDGWTARPKGEPVKDEAPTERSVEELLTDAFDKAENPALASVPWLDEALKPYADDLAKHGLSPRDAIGRLLEVEQGLRSDAPGTLERLALAFAGRADDGAKLEAANRLLRAMGYEAPGALAQAERARLQEFERQHGETRVYANQARQRVVEQGAKFVEKIGGVETFQRVRPYMLAAVQAGLAHDFDSAFEFATKHVPDAHPRAQSDAAAKAADDARRSKVASAKAAGTPQTKSAPGRHTSAAEPNKSIEDLLGEAWDERGLGG